MSAKRTVRGVGTYLTIAQLIRVLPSDYMLHITREGKEVWSGVSWVFLYDSVFIKFTDAFVRRFEVNYYNTDVEIEIQTL